MSDNPKVSICMLTYNHEKYIDHALKSILCQKVDFLYEIVIGDDCSSDRTREVLLDYKKKYPDKIKLVLHKRNFGVTKNMYSVMKHMRGQYIAFLEGDDYWCDDLKLKQQVDFLDKHIEYIGCTHSYHVVDEGDIKIASGEINPTDYMFNTYIFKNNECTLKDYENTMGIPSHMNTLMIRNIYVQDRDRYRFLYQLHPVIGDQSVFVWILSHGRLYMMPQDMSAYRLIIKKGNSNATSILAGKNRRAEYYEYQCKMEKYAYKYWNCKVDLTKYKDNLLVGAVCVWTKDKNRENHEVVKKIIHLSRKPFRTWYKIVITILNKTWYEIIGRPDKRIKV